MSYNFVTNFVNRNSFFDFRQPKMSRGFFSKFRRGNVAMFEIESADLGEFLLSSSFNFQNSGTLRKVQLQHRMGSFSRWRILKLFNFKATWKVDSVVVIRVNPDDPTCTGGKQSVVFDKKNCPHNDKYIEQEFHGRVGSSVNIESLSLEERKRSSLRISRE